MQPLLAFVLLVVVGAVTLPPLAEYAPVQAVIDFAPNSLQEIDDDRGGKFFDIHKGALERGYPYDDSPRLTSERQATTVMRLSAVGTSYLPSAT
jgi:hypothetical protein